MLFYQLENFPDHRAILADFCEGSPWPLYKPAWFFLGYSGSRQLLGSSSLGDTERSDRETSQKAPNSGVRRQSSKCENIRVVH